MNGMRCVGACEVQIVRPRALTDGSPDGSAEQSNWVQNAFASVGETPKQAKPSWVSHALLFPSPSLGRHGVPHRPVVWLGAA
jgi:hypothetical protein